MPSIQEIRKQYPQYNDLSDDQLMSGMHKKYYSDMPFDDFKSRLSPTPFEVVKQRARPERVEAVKNVDELGSEINEYMPGKNFNEHLDTIGETASQYVPEWMSDAAYKASIPLRGAAMAADEAAKQYGSYAWGVARGVPVAGAYLDEAIAGVGSIFGQDYDNTVNHIRAIDDVVERDRGGANLAGKIAGGIGAGYGVGGQVIKAGAPLLANTARSAAATMGIGAGHRFGDAEGGLDNRAKSAASGLGTDAAIGAAFPLAGHYLAKPATKALDWVAEKATGRGLKLPGLGQSDDTAADAILAGKLKSSGISPDEILDDLAKGQRAGRMNANSNATLPETIADTSDSMRRFAGSIYRQGDEAGEIIKKTLETRQKGPKNFYAPSTTEPKGQLENVIDAFDRALLTKTSGTARATENALVEAQKKVGRELYANAYRQSEAFDLKSTMSSALNEAKIYPKAGKISKSLRKAASLFMRGKKGKVSTIQEFDAAKKELDDMIDKSIGNKKRLLTEFKNKLLGAIHKVDADGNPTANLAYKEARDSWGSNAERREAIDLGRKAFKQDSEVTIEQFRELTKGQQQLFRIGARESLRNALGNKRAGNDATLLFQQQRIKEMLREIIPSSKGQGVFNDRPARFGEFMNRQERMGETRKTVLGGSPTAKNQADDLDFKTSALQQQWQRLMGTPFVGLAGELVTAGMTKVLGFRKGVATKLAERLMNSNPEQQIRILNKIRQRTTASNYQAFLESIDQNMVALGVGSATVKE